MWQGGTYWAAGPWWGNYMYSAEPVDGQDTPQMKTIEQYEHRGATSSTLPAPVTQTTATVGSGADQLALSIAEDAYQGDAQYTVSVDGRQVGGVQTAHSSQASGGHDTLLVDGDWSAGNHVVGVNFLNDAYGGTSSTDRNLHVDGATYDGAAAGNSRLTLLSSGTQTFAFHKS